MSSDVRSGNQQVVTGVVTGAAQVISIVGMSVALDDKTVLGGAPFANTAVSGTAGKAYRFDSKPIGFEIELSCEGGVGVLPPVVQQRCCPRGAGLRQGPQARVCRNGPWFRMGALPPTRILGMHMPPGVVWAR